MTRTSSLYLGERTQETGKEVEAKSLNNDEDVDSLIQGEHIQEIDKELETENLNEEHMGLISTKVYSRNIIHLPFLISNPMPNKIPFVSSWNLNLLSLGTRPIDSAFKFSLKHMPVFYQPKLKVATDVWGWNNILVHQSDAEALFLGGLTDTSSNLSPIRLVWQPPWMAITIVGAEELDRPLNSKQKKDVVVKGSLPTLRGWPRPNKAYINGSCGKCLIFEEGETVHSMVINGDFFFSQSSVEILSM